MATIVTRSGKGSPLTHAEVDSNFTNLNTDKLELSGGTMTGNLSFGDNDKAIFGAGSDLQIYHDGADSYVREQGTGDLVIQGGANIIFEKTGGEDMLTMANDGSVVIKYNGVDRIETTTAGIDVTGTVTADGLTVDKDGVGGISLNSGGTSGTSGLRLNATDASGNGGGIVDIKGTSPSNGFGELTIATRTGATPKDRFNISSGGDISFYEDTGTTAKFFWDASAESLGIGTSSPSTLLHLSSSTNTYQTIESTSGSSNALTYYKNGSVAVDGVSIGLNALEQMMLWQSENNVMRFGTNNTERMRIDSSGNVGIGTSSPDELLHLASNDCRIKMVDTDDTAGDFAEIRYLNSRFIFSADDGNVASGSSIEFQVDNSEAMRIDSSGNVGIGGAPDTDRRLHIQGASFQEVIVEKTDATTSAILLAADSGLGSIYTRSTASNSTAIPLTFHTGNSEAMRIDSSGNLLVGKTSTNIATAGHNFWSDGLTDHTRDASSEVMRLNKLNNDGDIVTFRKDGSTVGSIGVSSNYLYIGDNVNAGLHFVSSAIRPFDAQSQSISDNVVDFGVPTSRFKDLYLSGGVYLGGTGSANKLDDYEEGTWTPTAGTYFGTFSNEVGKYVKIGGMVYIKCYFNFTGASTSQIRAVGGLPFTPANDFVSSSIEGQLQYWGDARGIIYAKQTGFLDLDITNGLFTGSLSSSDNVRIHGWYRTTQ